MTNQRGNRLLETQTATMFCVEIAETMEQRQRQGELMKTKALKERNIFVGTGGIKCVKKTRKKRWRQKAR